MDINLVKQNKKVQTTDKPVIYVYTQGHWPSKTKQKGTTDQQILSVYRHGHRPSKTKQKGINYRYNWFISVYTQGHWPSKTIQKSSNYRPAGIICVKTWTSPSKTIQKGTNYRPRGFYLCTDMDINLVKQYKKVQTTDKPVIYVYMQPADSRFEL